MKYWPKLVHWLIDSSPSSSSSSSSSEHNDDGESNPSINDDLSYEQSTDPPCSSSSSKRRRCDGNGGSPKRVAAPKKIWTKDDELELLRGFLEYTNEKRIVLFDRRRNQKDHVSSFYDGHVAPALKLKFNRLQVVEKLRRLKKKYGGFSSKAGERAPEFRFRNEHESAAFGISHEIWRRSGETPATWHSTRAQARREEEMGSDLRGLVMGLGLNYPVELIKLCDENGGKGLKMEEEDDDEGEGEGEWKKEEQIVEFEVYLRRLEFVQSKVKAVLEKLRAKTD